MKNELARAEQSEITIVPLIFKGANLPIQVSSLCRVEIEPLDDSASAADMLNVVEMIRPSIDRAMEREMKNCDSSDGTNDFDSADELVDELTGTRWSWCENDNFTPDEEGKWIEFQANGKLYRSWQPKPTRWKVSTNGFVLYTPHVLSFDMAAGRFQGAVSDPGNAKAERSGRRLKK